MNQIFEKSIAVTMDLKKGTVLDRKMLKGLKPGTGIAICDIEKVINRTLGRDLKKHTLLAWDDII